MWFAWKFVPLWYQQQPLIPVIWRILVVICLKIRTFVVSATTRPYVWLSALWLWFAWKFVPLWYQQQPFSRIKSWNSCCDLLENSYLCGISNNATISTLPSFAVVICLKIRTFVVSATTGRSWFTIVNQLWFAWKFVPLWYQQQLQWIRSCQMHVVICLKIRTFVVSATT